MMLRFEAPIVFRIAMSRVFSITSRINEAMMLSAATMTINPMPMPMPIFSSINAEYSSWLMSVQSWVRYSGPNSLGDLIGNAGRVVGVCDLHLDMIDADRCRPPRMPCSSPTRPLDESTS